MSTAIKGNMRNQLMVATMSLFLSCIVSLSSLHAQVILFKDGQQIPDYNEVAESLKPEDLLKFSNGESFELIRKLGAGSTTLVWEAKNKQSGQVVALRIPLKRGMFRGESENDRFALRYIDFINSYIVNGPKLESLGIGPAIFSSQKNEYVAVEALPVVFNFLDFLHMAAEDSQFIQAKNALQAFAKGLSWLSWIGDFRMENIVYTADQRWLLIDHTDEIRPFSGRVPDFEFLFYKMFSVPAIELRAIDDPPGRESESPDYWFIYSTEKRLRLEWFLGQILRERWRKIGREDRNPLTGELASLAFNRSSTESTVDNIGDFLGNDSSLCKLVLRRLAKLERPR